MENSVDEINKRIKENINKIFSKLELSNQDIDDVGIKLWNVIEYTRQLEKETLIVYKNVFEKVLNFQQVIDGCQKLVKIHNKTGSEFKELKKIIQKIIEME